MREFSYRIVCAFDDWWYWIGWALFVALVVEFLTPAIIVCPMAFVGTVLLWLAWWAIDAASQGVKAWQVVVGVAMLVIGCLPRGQLLFVACWVIYCLQVRE